MTRKSYRPRRGLTVAILGPDGAGKSTLARNLSKISSLPVRTVYMGGNPESAPYILPTTRLLVQYGKRKAAHGGAHAGGSNQQVARPTAVSRLSLAVRETVKFSNELLEYFTRFMVARSAKRRGEIVVFDRYVYDAWIDAIADDASRWRWLRAVILKSLFPRPDMLLVLEASPELMFARKGEHTPQRLQRVQLACREIAGNFKRVGYIDASQPPEQVAREAVAYIEKFAYTRRGREVSRGGR